MTPSPSPDPEQLAAALEATGDYRVLRRLHPLTQYHPPDGSATGTAIALDVETTGLEPGRDAIIQLALVPFTYARESGKIFDIGQPLTLLEDPGRPIPTEITALTGITDAAVAGKRIDERQVEAVTGTASLVIAHNAAFDRRFVEQRLPLFRDKAWACSYAEIPWRTLGSKSSSLEYLLTMQCGVFYGAHQADTDCFALIHLLATPLQGGELPLQLLLTSARQKSVRIWAEQAPIAFKDALKSRRYRWNNGDDRRPKAWYREVPLAEKEAELEWLTTAVFGGRARPLRMDVLDAKTRYSDRG